MNGNAMTLSRHIIEAEHRFHNTTGELSRLLAQVGFAAKVLAREIGRAALVGQLGLVGERNATGDAQKKLDVYANNVVIDAFAETGLVAGVVSEELEETRIIAAGVGAKYLLVTDPLDGSSNTDINGAIGTIFGIYRRNDVKADITTEVLRNGADLVAAGYVFYGTSTMLVYTCGFGVNGFTLDRALGEFLLSHENMQCPKKGRYYSANIGHFYEWSHGVKKYIDYAEESDPASGRPYALRYSGALVADVHRCLVEGGLYFYPPDNSHKDGKLRLMYECAPLGYVVQQAGGKASDGTRNVLEITPKSIHERCPLIIGSKENVEEYEGFLAGAASSS